MNKPLFLSVLGLAIIFIASSTSASSHQQRSDPYYDSQYDQRIDSQSEFDREFYDSGSQHNNPYYNDGRQRNNHLREDRRLREEQMIQNQRNQQLRDERLSEDRQLREQPRNNMPRENMIQDNMTQDSQSSQSQHFQQQGTYGPENESERLDRRKRPVPEDFAGDISDNQTENQTQNETNKSTEGMRENRMFIPPNNESQDIVNENETRYEGFLIMRPVTENSKGSWQIFSFRMERLTNAFAAIFGGSDPADPRVQP